MKYKETIPLLKQVLELAHCKLLPALSLSWATVVMVIVRQLHLVS